MRRRMRGKRETNVDLDITSFMNLMVILIPFLLLNAVFTQISVLKIDLPGSAPNSAEAPKPPPLILDINVYADRFEVNNAAVANGSNNLLGTVAATDYAGLNQLMRNIKQQYPDVNNATLRLENGTDYQKMISTMDAVRIVISDKTQAVYPLFPELQLASVEGAS